MPNPNPKPNPNPNQIWRWNFRVREFFFALVFSTLKVKFLYNKLFSGHVAKIRTSLSLLVQKLCPTLILMSNPNPSAKRNPNANYKSNSKVNINSNRYTIKHFTTL